MSLKIYLITMAISLLLSGISCLFDYKVAYGILLSSSFSLVNMYLLSLGMKLMIANQQLGQGLMMLSSIVRTGLLLCVLYIAIRNPQIFSLVGVVIGFTLFMAALLIDAAAKKGGE